MRRVWRALNGPQTIENGPLFWTGFLLAILLVAGFPLYGSQFWASNLALFFLYVPMALGLSLLWGFTGILSFGQVAFFGIGGYMYGVIAGNLLGPVGILGAQGWESAVAIVGAVAAAAVVAAVFGYFVFYGQVSAWIVPLLTLVLALVLEAFLAQTAGYQWRVGTVLLGGYNGMTNIPSIRVGQLAMSGGTTSFLYLVVALTTLVYLGLRALVNSLYGHVLVAIREDVERTRMLGHNVPRRQVEVFVIAAALAALSGTLYSTWGSYIDPSTMNLFSAALPVIWVAVGGRRSLTGVVLSTVLLGYLADFLSVRGGEWAFVVQGALLVIVMMFFREGIFFMIARRLSRAERRRRGLLAVPRPAGGSE